MCVFRVFVTYLRTHLKISTRKIIPRKHFLFLILETSNWQNIFFKPTQKHELNIFESIFLLILFHSSVWLFLMTLYILYSIIGIFSFYGFLTFQKLYKVKPVNQKVSLKFQHE